MDTGGRNFDTLSDLGVKYDDMRAKPVQNPSVFIDYHTKMSVNELILGCFRGIFTEIY